MSPFKIINIETESSHYSHCLYLSNARKRTHKIVENEGENKYVDEIFLLEIKGFSLVVL